jgi:crotonobetainyl-CoA:carnitine CoA-transferase CaiB-like acyl-CoA transferase
VHLDLVQPMTLPSGQVTRTVTCPVRLDGRNVPVNTRPPSLGEDTEAVMAWFDKRRSRPD